MKQRPDVTQKGLAMIGDFRTDALHQALEDESIAGDTLVGLLVLALSADNVTIHTGFGYGAGERAAIRDRISNGGVLTADATLLNAAARDMLKIALSCRDNMTNSGVSSRIAGETLGASAHLPTMATEEFLSCLSRQALERGAAAEGIKVEVRVKDTRAAMVKHFGGQTWHFPGALFPLTEEERIKEEERANVTAGRAGWISSSDAEIDDLDEAGAGEPEANEHPDEDSPYAVAAE
jgi:hypothetical protein